MGDTWGVTLVLTVPEQMVPVHGVCVFDPGLSSFMCQNCPLILVKRIRKTLFKITALGVMAVGMDGGDGAEL